MSKLTRIEVWSDLECDSGTHQATLAKGELLKGSLAEDVNGRGELTIQIDRASVAWTSIQERRILRVVKEDGAVSEYRITAPEEGRETSGGELATIKARSILYDLLNGLVIRTEATGVVSAFYTLLARTRAGLMTQVLASAESYFASGTVDDSSTVVDVFTFDFDSPLKALQELGKLEGLEVAVRRNGATNYYVDLTVVGSGASDVPEFRYRKNLTGVKRRRDAAKMANRLYGAGGGDGAVRLSLGQAIFTAATVPTGSSLTVAPDAIFTDGHLQGEYIERVSDGTRFLISSTTESTQTIVTSSAHGMSAGHKFRLRADNTGTHLMYVEDPDSQSTYGVQSDVLEGNDLPMVSNLLGNAALADWSGGDPDLWADVLTPTVTEETQEAYTQAGGSSAKVVADIVGEGLKSTAVTIYPSDPHVFFSVSVGLYVESGAVEVYALHSVDGRFPVEGALDNNGKPIEAFTSETGRWIQLKIEGKEWQAGTVEIFVLSKDGAATFYLDWAQLSQTSKVYPFIDGDAGAKLWGRCLAALNERSIPLVSYELTGLDLYAIDPATWPHDEITLGGQVVVYDEELTFDALTRGLRMTRDILTGQVTRLELSNRREDLIDVLTLTARRIRQLEDVRPGIALVGQFKVSVRQDGKIVLQVFGAGTCKSFRYIVDLQTMATYPEVVDSGGDGVSSNLVDGSEVVVSAIRNSTDTELGPDQRAYIRVVVFPLISGGGTPGATDSAVSEPPTFWYAEIIGTNVNQSGSSPDVTVRRTFSQVDKRTAAVHVYRRKTSWPTIDGGQASALDPAYDRGLVGPRDGWKYEDAGWATNDVVRDIAIAVDPQGRDGEREEDSYTVLATAGPQFATTARYDQSDGTSCEDPREVRVQWTTSGGVTDGSHDVRVYRRIDGGFWDLITTVTDPVTTTSYDDEDVPMYYGGLDRRLIDYRLDLWDGSEVDDSELLEETRGGRYWYLCDYSE